MHPPTRISRALVLVSLLFTLAPRSTLASPAPTSTASAGDQCGKPCDGDTDPVCGTDGRTYLNVCWLRRQACKDPSLEVASTGTCPISVTQSVDCQSILCPANFDPVCASDGNTYSNLCQLEAAACLNPTVRLVIKGPCPSLPPSLPSGVACARACPATFDPICASDNRTYRNPCEFESAACAAPGLQLVLKGICPARPRCDRICPKIYLPVCGTDGVSYDNRCLLGVRRCETGNKGLKVAFVGPCPPAPLSSGTSVAPRPTESVPTDLCDRVCPFNFDPVCGDDGKTYPNACALEIATCLAGVKLASTGECPISFPTARITPPPTGTVWGGAAHPTWNSGKWTEGDETWWSTRGPKRSSRSKSSTKTVTTTTTRAGDGGDRECEWACPEVYDPVCGSDLRTYANMCFLSIAVCRNTALQIANVGEC
ncbi:hypothetical protein HDU96_010278 [Phlyctochytrium bullatum]|nr:hypothetical protein HDU96_010278 [Phlyctochytrium bullatum]